MKNNIYKMLPMLAIVLTGFTSCLDFEEQENMLPDMVMVDKAKTMETITITSVHLFGTSDKGNVEDDAAGIDYKAHFKMSLQKEMEYATTYKALCKRSLNKYDYDTEVTDLVPNTTYYCQLVVADIESEVEEVVTPEPCIHPLICDVGKQIVGFCGYANYRPAKAYFLLSTSSNMDNAQVIPATITSLQADYHQCQASTDEMVSGTEYYYCLVIEYMNGQGETVKTISDIETFTSSSYLQLESVKFINPDESEAKSMWDWWNLLVVDSKGKGTNIEVLGKFDNSFVTWWLKTEYSLGPENYTIYGYMPGQTVFNETCITVKSLSYEFYGKQEGISSKNNKVNMTLTSPLAQVKLQLQTTEDMSETRIIDKIGIETSEFCESATFDMATGLFSDFSQQSIKERVLGNPKTTLSTTPYEISFFVIPHSISIHTIFYYTLADGTIKKFTLTDDSSYLNFESGKCYTLPVIITATGLQIGDVSVEQWQEGGNGTIIIN